jgi:hypothetical protein
VKRVQGRSLRYFLYGVAVAVFAAHFALTFLFVLPPNPIKTLTNLDQLYTGWFFYQDWGLFSPDPIQMDISVHFQCLGDGTSTPMLDATTGLWKARMSNPFSHYDRVGRVSTSYAHAFLMPARQETPLLTFCQENSGHDTCVALEWQRERKRESIEMGFMRLASAFCADMRDRFNTAFNEARIWIAMADVPRWSRRYVDTKEPYYTPTDQARTCCLLP